jgi:hypothetical protein
MKQMPISKDNWQDIGYYTDEKGYKRYGPIPKKNNILWQN